MKKIICFAAITLLLFLFVTCRKNDKLNNLINNETVSLNEVINWDTTFCSSVANSPLLELNKAQQTIFNNKFYMRVPVKNSGGYFYFTKEDKVLTPIFIRAAADKNGALSGHVEFLNLNAKTYHIISFVNNKRDSVYSIKDFNYFFQIFIQFNSTNKTSSSINDGDKKRVDLLAPPCDGKIDCPPNPNGSGGGFWAWLSGVFSAIGDWVSNLFSGSEGGGGGSGGDISYVSWEYSGYTSAGSTTGNNTGGGGTSNNPTWNGVPAANLVDANGFLISRINQIQALLNANAFALIPCDSLNLMPLNPETGYGLMYKRVAQVQVSQTLEYRIDSIKTVARTAWLDGFSVQTLDNAYGKKVNCDYFSVNIKSLPKGMTPDALVEFFRKNTNMFSNPNASFSPYSDGKFSDSAKFNLPYEQSVGALVHLQMPNNGTVIESNYYRNASTNPEKYRFVYTTLTSPLDNNHPVSGNREFGIFGNASTGYTFYTMGVDRISDWEFATADLVSFGAIFKGADALWTVMQNNMKNYINANGGNATINTPVKARPFWNDVHNFLLGNKVTYQQLLAELGCL
jgi:hypothetical protein